MLAKSLWIVIGWLGFSASLSAQVLWSRQIPRYGGGDSEGTAYAQAEALLRRDFAQLSQSCKNQGGSFSSRMQRSFCDPYDPGSLFDSQTCLVIGYAYCQSDPVNMSEEVVLREIEGNQNTFIEPGEKAAIVVTLKNSGQRPLTSLTLAVATSGAQPVLALQESEFALGNLAPGESKTITFNGTVLPAAPCGSRVTLSFTAKATAFLHRFPAQLLVGKLTEKPIVFEAKGVSMPLTAKGISYLLGEVPAPGKDVSQLIFSYNATVKTPSKYRLWLTAPNGQAIWAYFKDESRTEISFSRDLTEYLKNGQTPGKWHLSGDMGAGNTAVIRDYKLVIVPNSFECL